MDKMVIQKEMEHQQQEVEVHIQVEEVEEQVGH